MGIIDKLDGNRNYSNNYNENIIYTLGRKINLIIIGYLVMQSDA